MKACIRALALLSSGLLAACAGPVPAPFRESLSPVFDEDLRALEESRAGDLQAWEPFLVAGDAALRGAAWRAIARAGPELAVDELVQRAALEGDPRVLAEACAALARRGAAGAHVFLAGLVQHADARVRAAALRALATLPWKDTWKAQVTALRDPHPYVRGEAAASLARILGRRLDPPPEPEEQILVEVAEALSEAVLADRVPFVRWRAMYALSELVDIEKHPASVFVLLNSAMVDQAGIRYFAARTFARLTEHPYALTCLLRLARDKSWRVAVAALQGLAGKVSGKGRETLRAELARQLEREGVYHRRQALIEVLGEDPFASDLLQQALRNDPSRAVRVAAFTALHRADPQELAGVRAQWLAGSDFILREAAVRALAEEPDHRAALAALVAACADPSPLVRAAALEVLFEQRARLGQHEILRRILMEKLRGADLGDAGVVATLLEKALASDDGPGWVVELEAGLRAARERFQGVEGLEIGPLIARVLGEAAQIPGPDQVPFSAVDLSAIARDPHRRVRITTDRGELLLELDGVNAPRHCASFLALAEEGRYDGLIFHRMVPDFVLQGFDPRGDGWGSGGVRLPSETSARIYGAGVVGTPDAGLDTGGCQLFFTYVQVPRLVGRYTRFAQVIRGRVVLDQLERGDRILKVEALAPR